MYVNNVHILYYAVFLILGGLIGLFMQWCNKRLPDEKKVFSKDIIKQCKIGFKPNYLLSFVVATTYVLLLYRFGLNLGNALGNLDLLKYLILTPMLCSVFVIDYKLQIIPNRLNLTMFEVGLAFTFISGIININAAINSLLGMLIGGAIFLLLTVVGGIIAGKEAMGLGDVKLMGALGLFFGMQNIIVISVIAFLVGAILSIILLVSKIKKTSEYIPFGPFIVIASFVSIFVPFEVLYTILIKIFTLGML